MQNNINNIHGLRAVRSPPPLQETLERIREIERLSVESFADRIELRGQEYRSFLERRRAFKPEELSQAARIYRTDPEVLLNGEFDFRALAREIEGEKPLRERYTTVRYSRMRTVISVLDALEEYLGWRARLRVMRDVGLDENTLSDPLQTCNIRLITDICSIVQSRFKIGAGLFQDLGAHSTITYSNSPLADAFASYTCPRDLYEACFGPMVPHYEHNHAYQIQTLEDDFCSVTVTPLRDVVEAFQTKSISSHENCRVKAGIMSTVLGYIGLPCAHVFETECIYQGSSRCHFEVDFGYAYQAYRERKTGT